MMEAVCEPEKSTLTVEQFVGINCVNAVETTIGPCPEQTTLPPLEQVDVGPSLKQLDANIRRFIREVGTNTLSIKMIRERLEDKYGLKRESLKCRNFEIEAIAEMIMTSPCTTFCSD